MRTRREAVALAVTALATVWSNARAGAQTPSVATTLCPTGKLRAAVIVSNPVLVTRGVDGVLGGVSTVVARALSAHFGMPIELVPFYNAASYNESHATDN